MHDCVAVCGADCRSASSLRHLDVESSTIEAFHERGVSACCSLKTLWCQTRAISAVDPLEDLTCNDDNVRVPTGLSALTALTQLTVQSAQEIDLCFGWLSQLKCLQELHVTTSAALTLLPECLSTLTRLTRMELSNMGNAQSKIRVDSTGQHLCL